MEWNGEVYRITPTMKLINRIEQDISLSSLAVRIQGGDIPLSQLATAFALLLRAGGCNTNAEQVYVAMFSNEQAQNVAAQAANALMMACFPSNMPVQSVKKEPVKKKASLKK